MDWDWPLCTTTCIDAICANRTDEACICPEKRGGATPWRPDLDDCISGNCENIEYYKSAGITYHKCDIANTIESKHALLPLIISTTAIQFIFFVFRMAVIRIKRDRTWWWDDLAFIASSLVLGLTIPVLALEVNFGFHRNLWTLTIWNIDHYTQVFFAYSLLYALSLAAIKLSICFLYLRIFRAQQPAFRYLIWATVAFNIAIWIIFTVGLFFACRPLPFYWAYAAPVDGDCPDPIDKGLVYPILNIMMDSWLLVLPMTQIWNMRLPWGSKLGVCVMFGLGLVTAMTTILRIWMYRQNLDRWILGLDILNGLNWSVIEVTTAYVISCMPATRFLFVHIRARFLGARQSNAETLPSPLPPPLPGPRHRSRRFFHHHDILWSSIKQITKNSIAASGVAEGERDAVPVRAREDVEAGRAKGGG